MTPWLPKQATALIRKQTVLACVSSDKTSAKASHVASSLATWAFVVARTAGAGKPPISRNEVTDAVKPSQLFDGDMDHVAGLGPFVSAHQRQWLQAFETSKAYGLESSTHGGEQRRKQPGEAFKRPALMALHNSLLQFLGIEHPPLGAAPAATIHQVNAAAGAL